MMTLLPLYVSTILQTDAVRKNNPVQRLPFWSGDDLDPKSPTK